VKIHLVRHARAVSRTAWQGSRPSGEERAPNGDRGSLELLRPLSKAGREQAAALADHLVEQPPARLLASPALRCQQTLEPLALALDLPVEVDDRLADDEDVARLLALLPELADAPTVLCTHARPIATLLDVLELSDDSGSNGSPCRKGALWTLEGAGYRPERAVYVEPALRRKNGRVQPAFHWEAARARSVRAAVLDLGSTSFTLLIADVTREGVIQPVVREKVMLRLGAVIAARDKIPSATAQRVVEVARELRQLAAQEKVQHFLPVATSALREPRNGRKVAEKIGRVVGEPVRILEGEAEARLMFGAFQQRLALDHQPVVGLDLGGGSLELAAGCGRRIDAETTLPLGAVRLHGEFVHSDRMRPRERRRIRERVQQALAPHREALLRRGPTRIVAAGGTARTLARMLAAQRGEASPDEAMPLALASDELRALVKRLLRSSHDERLAMPGMRRRRADLLPAGALVILSVAELLEIEDFTLCDWGLREGVLRDCFAREEP
jgi:exopolyphosphatase/guanosine-5'-triphosphate,3'-diphosphate pyrophosphatase